jgi:hypothetical protein
MGMVIFLALAGTIYQNLALQKVGKALPNLDATEITSLVAGTSSQTYKALSQAEKDMLAPAVTSAVSNVWLFFLVAGALSFVLTPFLGVSCLSLSSTNVVCQKDEITKYQASRERS